MKYRRLGNAGMKVSEISIGGWLTFGGTVDADTSGKILDTAIGSGVNFIDLADIYSKGEAEKVSGEMLKKYKRSDLVVSSKLFWPMSDNINDKGLSRKHIVESIDKTLARLQMDYIDIYFCHRYDPETGIEEVVRAMDDVIRQGKVIYWGTSVWEPPQLDDAVSFANKFNCYRPQVEQPRYNMLDRNIEMGVMPTCKRNGMGLVVWSPLCQGILTGKYNDGKPEGSRGATSAWLRHDLTDANIEKVRQMTAIADELGITMAQLALAWVLRLPEISSAITGATSLEQIKSNIAASDVELSSDVLAKIDSILSQD